jgi:hypothetical protein
LRFVQSRVAQLDLAPTCSVRFEICNFNAARFGDHSACATPAVFVETHRL